MLPIHHLLTLLLLVWIRCTSSSSSLVSKEDVGLILYTDVSPANTSDSLQKIRDVPIKVYGNANGADYAMILPHYCFCRVQVRQCGWPQTNWSTRTGRTALLPRVRRGILNSTTSHTVASLGFFTVHDASRSSPSIPFAATMWCSIIFQWWIRMLSSYTGSLPFRN